MYDLYKHVSETSLSPDLYLVDWVYTLFSKSMNLDLACRIWDLIFRDGEIFIFRAALGKFVNLNFVFQYTVLFVLLISCELIHRLGIMHLSKNELLKMDFLRGAQYLTKLPDDIDSDKLFKSISSIRMSNGSLLFEDLLGQYEDLIRMS